MKKNNIGIIGLSVMGRNLALNLADHNYHTAVYNRSRNITEEVIKKYPHEYVHPYFELKTFVDSLERPRKVILMIKAGNAIDEIIKKLSELLEVGDIIVDGGNSYYQDSERRFYELKRKGLYFFGTGISGGEKGARNGPAIMPGGDKKVYEILRPFLESIAAKVENQCCVTYIGPAGAGHFVKMVHNGIEYADMQLIAEAYLILKYGKGYTNRKISELFHEWNQGELNSYLMKISADILLEKENEYELIDLIMDCSSQKGTGKWASIEAMNFDVDLSIISSALNARYMSNMMELRNKGSQLWKTEKKELIISDEAIRQALYLGKISAYAQGFYLMKMASEVNNWQLDYAAIASIFRGGCIIQAHLLEDIMAAYQKNPQLSHLLFDEKFANKIIEYRLSLVESVTSAMYLQIGIPTLSASLTYLDLLANKNMGANLIQAQRDTFGAHSFERIDKEGFYHHEWSSHYE